MSLEEQISKDYVQAMKQGDKLKSSTVNFLRAQLKNIIIDKKVDKLDDVDVIAAIKKQTKQREDSIDQYQKADRQDLADKEKAELEILKSYLPEEMSEEQVKSLIEEALVECEAKSMKDMGKIMKTVMSKSQGKADNKMVSELVKSALSQL